MWKNYGCAEAFPELGELDEKSIDVIQKIMNNKKLYTALRLIMFITGTIFSGLDFALDAGFMIHAIFSPDAEVKQNHKQIFNVFSALIKLTKMVSLNVVNLDEQVRTINPKSNFIKEILSLKFDGDFNTFEGKCDKIFNKETYNYSARDFVSLLCTFISMFITEKRVKKGVEKRDASFMNGNIKLIGLLSPYRTKKGKRLTYDDYIEKQSYTLPPTKEILDTIKNDPSSYKGWEVIKDKRGNPTEIKVPMTMSTSIITKNKKIPAELYNKLVETQKQYNSRDLREQMRKIYRGTEISKVKKSSEAAWTAYINLISGDRKAILGELRLKGDRAPKEVINAFSRHLITTTAELKTEDLDIRSQYARKIKIIDDYYQPLLGLLTRPEMSMASIGTGIPIKTITDLNTFKKKLDELKEVQNELDINYSQLNDVSYAREIEKYKAIGQMESVDLAGQKALSINVINDKIKKVQDNIAVDTVFMNDLTTKISILKEELKKEKNIWTNRESLKLKHLNERITIEQDTALNFEKNLNKKYTELQRLKVGLESVENNIKIDKDLLEQYRKDKKEHVRVATILNNLNTDIYNLEQEVVGFKRNIQTWTDSRNITEGKIYYLEKDLKDVNISLSKSLFLDIRKQKIIDKKKIVDDIDDIENDNLIYSNNIKMYKGKIKISKTSINNIKKRIPDLKKLQKKLDTEDKVKGQKKILESNQRKQIDIKRQITNLEKETKKLSKDIGHMKGEKEKVNQKFRKNYDNMIEAVEDKVKLKETQLVTLMTKLRKVKDFIVKNNKKISDHKIHIDKIHRGGTIPLLNVEQFKVDVRKERQIWNIKRKKKEEEKIKLIKEIKKLAAKHPGLGRIVSSGRNIVEIRQSTTAIRVDDAPKQFREINALLKYYDSIKDHNDAIMNERDTTRDLLTETNMKMNYDKSMKRVFRQYQDKREIKFLRSGAIAATLGGIWATYPFFKFSVNVLPNRLKRIIFDSRQSKSLFDEVLGMIAGVVLGTSYLAENVITKRTLIKQYAKDVVSFDKMTDTDPLMNEVISDMITGKIGKEVEPEQDDDLDLSVMIDEDLEKYRKMKNKLNVDPPADKQKVIKAMLVQNEHIKKNPEKFNKELSKDNLLKGSYVGMISNNVSKPKISKKWKKRVHKLLCKMSLKSRSMSKLLSTSLVQSLAFSYISHKLSQIVMSQYIKDRALIGNKVSDLCDYAAPSTRYKFMYPSSVQYYKSPQKQRFI